MVTVFLEDYEVTYGFCSAIVIYDLAYFRYSLLLI